MKKNLKNILQDALKDKSLSKKEKKKIIQAIFSMRSLKPKIKVDKVFKKNLKVKMMELSKLKSTTNSHSNFSLLFIPAFSFVFIITWFYYYIWSTNFFTPQGKLEIKTMQETQMILDEKINTEEVSPAMMKSTRNFEADKEEVREVLKIEAIMQDDIIEEPNDQIETKTSDIETTSIIPVAETQVEANIIEDTQIDDVLWEIQWIEVETISEWEEDYVEGLFDELYYDEEEDMSDDLLDELLWGFGDEDEEIQEEATTTASLNFEDFCQQEWWEIIEEEEMKICKKENTQCVEEDYINNSCDFIEIK